MRQPPVNPQNPPFTGRRFRGRGRGGRARGRGRGNFQRSPGVMPGVDSGTIYSAGASRAITITQSEVWADVLAGGKALLFKPSVVALPSLKNIAAGYRRFKVQWVQIEYEPAVGTTTDGVVHWGIYPGAFSGTPRIEDAKALYPRASGPVWRRSTLQARHDLLQVQPWEMTDSTAFSLVYYAHVAADSRPGFFEIKYSVVLDLPQKV